MTARRFSFFVLIISGALVLALVAINYYVDLYGLFRTAKGRSISIYSDERTAKYLLAFNYVPDNFDGYILGPSLSANLDPKGVSGQKVYNLSMMGANITEESAVVRKALERATPKFVILCLHPYLTADHGMKTGMINRREFYGSLGSVSLYKSYFLKFIRDHNLMPAKYPSDQFNEYGCNHYNNLLQKMPVADKIAEQLTLPDAIRPAIDPVAWVEFNDLVDELTKKNVRIVAYFHPLPFLIYDKFRGPLNAYQATMAKALKHKATVIDFNAPGYEFFTKDLTNYIDHGHLSDPGQAYILNQILRESHLTR